MRRHIQLAVAALAGLFLSLMLMSGAFDTSAGPSVAHAFEATPTPTATPGPHCGTFGCGGD